MSTRDNRFARQAKQNDRTGRDNQPTVDEQLSRLEEDIRRLKIEYDIYFNNATRRPPYDTKSRVETLIKRLADERTFTFAQRYRYNSLGARYTSFREMWRRTLQEREEGRDTPTNSRVMRNQSHKEERAQTRAAIFVCTDAHREAGVVRELYEALVAAKQACGEITDDLSFPRFHRMVAANTDALKAKLACERVRFSVGVEDGRVSFKAKADE